MWKASFQLHGVILMALAAEVCSMACKVGIFDVCNNKAEPTIPEKGPPPRSDFLYFQNAGDIERMTIPKDDKLIQISFINGSVMSKNHDGLVQIQGANNESMTMNVHTLEVTVSALDCVGEIIIKLDITKYGASGANETTCMKCGIHQRLDVSTSVNEHNEVKINSSFALIVFRKVAQPHITRKAASNVDIHMWAYQKTIVYERRNSDDVYLIKDKSYFWEEMYIQPANLLIRLMNSAEALYFHPNQPIRINQWEWNGAQLSASPFGEKFAKIVEKHVTRQVTFDADGCGTLEMDYHSKGGKLTARAYPPMLSVAVDKDTSMEFVRGDHVYWKNSRGIVKVDLRNNTVEMMDYTKSGTRKYFTEYTETKKWTGAAGSVEHFDERYVEDFDYVPPWPTDSDTFYKHANPFTWKMNFAMGSVDFPTNASMPKFRFHSADAGIADVAYDDDASTGTGFSANDAAGKASAHCHHTTNLTGSGAKLIAMRGSTFDESGSVVPATFFLRNLVGCVEMEDNRAVVHGATGQVLITPFKIDLD